MKSEKRFILSLLVLFCSLIGTGVVTATDAIECGTELVNVGDSEYELLEKCGEPTQRRGNELIYDQGTGSLLKIVTVGNGRVLSIQVGERSD
jgi:hypothetical protein